VDIQALIESAEQGHYGMVHVIVGSERLFVDRAVTALRKASVAQGDSWNEELFQGKASSAARIIDAARTLPMLGRVRFVWVRAAHELADKELDRLADYVNAPVETCCLVLTADKLDGRSRLAKLAKQRGFLTEAQPLKLAAMRGFVAREAKRRSLRLDDNAAAALVDCVGTDVSALDDALERLSLYVGRDQAIGLSAVEACVSRIRVESIWALIDAVSARDRRTALKAAGSLLGDREPPLRILAMVARQLRLVGRARQALDDGASPDAAAAAAGAPPFKARELAHAARRMSMPDLRRAFRILAEADLAQKGGKCPPGLALEGAILELTRPD
jgi:DNA polymerase-3 subunit delta